MRGGIKDCDALKSLIGDIEVEKRTKKNWETSMNEKEIKIPIERIEHRIYLN